MNQISYSADGGGGRLQPLCGRHRGHGQILSSLHTAHFQYIPALALPTKDTLNLRLNVPPSFRDPKSVVVVALPPVGAAKPPPLHPVNPAESFCAQKPGLVLPAEGAPLVFATQLAHDLTLHIETKARPGRSAGEGRSVAGRAGAGAPAPSLPGGELTGVGARQVGL